MGGEKPSPEPKLSELNERLQSGIETCRSVIDNYRALLTEDQSAAEAAAGEEDAAGDLPQPGPTPASK